jgi:hypothetical protein
MLASWGVVSRAQGDPAGTFRELVQGYEKAQEEFSRQYNAATTDADRMRVIQEKSPNQGKFTARLFELAERHPDSPVAIDALTWIVTHGQMREEGARSLSILLDRHIRSEKLGGVCHMVASLYQPRHAERALRDILERNPHHDAKGYATYYLGKLLLEDHVGMGKPIVGEKLLELVVKKFSDVRHWHGTLADAAEADLFELRHLAIGKVAPEIEGEDMDGVKFKLSDYRGKVVVIDFWGDW